MPASSPSIRSPRRTRTEQAEFYDHLVRTALQMFADGGFQAVSMRRLASVVGAPPMTLYRYFPSKLHLVRHLWEHILARAGERANLGQAGLEDPLARLRGYLGGFLQYWLEHPQHYWIVFAYRDEPAEPRGAATSGPPAPDLHAFLAALEPLVDGCAAPELDSRQRRQALELVVCKLLGFLLGAIGLPSAGWFDVPALKARVLDDIVGQLRQAGATPA